VDEDDVEIEVPFFIRSVAALWQFPGVLSPCETNQSGYIVTDRVQVASPCRGECARIRPIKPP
jgi:hypothetical protein